MSVVRAADPAPDSEVTLSHADARALRLARRAVVDAMVAAERQALEAKLRVAEAQAALNATIMAVVTAAGRDDTLTWELHGTTLKPAADTK